MNERARAIAILNQARDLLIERLTERIIDTETAILDEVCGLAYSSELDTLYEHFGLRLNHINVLLANLPPVESETAPQPTEREPADATMTAMTAETIYPMEQIDTVAFTQPSVYPEAFQGQSPVSLQLFTRQVQAGDVAAAGRSLAELFDLDETRALACAATFRDELNKSPDVLLKAFQLRHEIQSGSANSALVLLWECFGLQGMESVGVLQSLKCRLL
ncbi:MAG: hypothetical protein HY000_27925 [Planctomycetes bacterium]|nr:hypothetical protein [Planctomycetota bacterium]